MKGAPGRFVIRPLTGSPGADVERLVEASVAEGFRFLVRVQDEHSRGVNCFDGEGEVLLGAFQGGDLIAVGGLNVDPYGRRPRTGRIRHVYVHPSARRQGAGRALVRAVIAHAAPWFDQLVLRTDTAAAARFYEALGFSPEREVEGATHRLPLAGASALSS